MTKIDRKIVKYSVQKPEEKAAADKAAGARVAPQASEPEVVRDKNGRTAKVIRMHEKLERPEVLIGSTYKIKTPISDHAMYVTINDIVLNEGTEYEQRRPFEIFINSKNLDHFQWIVALTRIISAVFRKGGDVTFLVDEKRAEFQARTRQADAFAKAHFPEGAQLCGRCSTAAVVMMDGCMTCLNCGDSKCG